MKLLGPKTTKYYQLLIDLQLSSRLFYDKFLVILIKFIFFHESIKKLQQNKDAEHTTMLIWDPLGPFGNIWEHLVPFRNNQENLEPFGTICDHLGPFEIILYHFGSFGTIWTILDHLRPFGIIWDHLGPFGTIWTI